MKHRRHAPATQAAHLGRPPPGRKRPVNEPVVRASTVLFSSMAELEASYRHRLDRGHLHYGRYGTATTFALEDAVAEMEGGHGAVSLPSGVAAIALAFLSFVRPGDHVLVADSVYFPTRWFCDTALSRLGVEVSYYDPLVGAGIADLLRPQTRLVFLESPGSLTFEVQDVPAITAAARAAEAITVIDNTWATPLYFKPFEHGVDLSVQAATKYIVGHADAMLGLIVTGEAHYNEVRRTAMQLGQCASGDDAFLGLRGLRTLPVRLRRHHASGLAVARWLAERPEVARVIHPGLPGDPGHALWKRDFTGASGLFAFVLQPVSEDAVAAMLDGLELFGMGFSWGGFESLIVPAHPERFRTATRWEAEGPLLRVHVGLEAPEDLMADLARGFERLGRASAGGAA